MRAPDTFRRAVALLAISGALAGCDTPAGPQPFDSTTLDAAAGRYIVVFRSGTDVPAARAAALVASLGGELHHAYEAALPGFSATLSERAVDALRLDPDVVLIEPVTDAPGTALETATGWSAPPIPTLDLHANADARLATVQNSPPWGLDRIDQRDLPLDASYSYDLTGAGVRVYVISTGIRFTHQELGGRAIFGTDIGTPGGDAVDCAASGTFHSGIIGSATYGVAKGVTLVAVKATTACNSGLFADRVVAAVDWVVANAQFPALIFLGGTPSPSSAVDAAFAAANAAGLLTVTSAPGEACYYSPTRLPSTLVVTASSQTDARPATSSYGDCVDIHAPGVSIASLTSASDAATATASGQAFAAAFVAGVAALHLEADPTATPAMLTARILGDATRDRLTTLGNTPNLLLHVPLAAPSPAQAGFDRSALFVDFVRVAGSPGIATVPRDSLDIPRFTTGGGTVRTRTRAAPVEVMASLGTVATATFQLVNTGGAFLDWSAESPAAWVALSPADGTLAARRTTTIAATVDATGLTAGTTSTSIAVTDPAAVGSPTSLPLHATVFEAAPLVIGTAVTGLGGGSGSRRYFTVDVPEGGSTLTIAMSGGTGDGDVYVRYGDVPTLRVFDCAPGAGTNVEQCTAPARAGTYYVMVHAFFDFANASLVATLTGPPASPGSASSAAVAHDHVLISWEDRSTDETSFRLQRRLRPAGDVWGPWTSLTTVAANTTTFDYAPGGAENLGVQARVRACNAAGCSTWSPGPPVVTPPAAPAAFTGAAVTTTRIDLAWTDASSVETHFELETSVNDGDWSSQSLPPGTEELLIQGLTPGYLYAYRLRTCMDDFCSAWIALPVIRTAIPEAPSGAAATATSPTTVDVAWTDNSNDETLFRLQRRVEPGGTYTDVAELAPNTTLFTDTERSPGFSYRYRVRACSALGCSAFNSTAIVTTPPLPPSAPSAFSGVAASATRINLSWIDTAPNETRFELERSDDATATWDVIDAAIASNSTSYSDFTAASTVTYVYRLRACNTGGCSDFVQTADITTPLGSPAAPSSLVAVASWSNQVDLTWSDNSNVEATLTLQRSIDGGSSFQVVSNALPANSTAYSHTGLVSGTNYRYRIRACNAAGCSPYSAVSNDVTTPAPAPPAAPSALLTTPVSENRIDLAWTDNSSNETFFRIQRRDGAGNPFNTLAEVSVASYIDNTVVAGIVYTYRVRACNPDGCSVNVTGAGTSTTTPIPD